MSVLTTRDSEPVELPDAGLVAMARKGHADAFAALLQRHWRTAVRVAQRVVAHPEDVEDVMQEAALAAYLNLPSLATSDRFLGWYCGIVLNHCRMLQRRQRRSPQTQPLDGSEPATFNDVETVVREKRLLANVQTALQALPTAQKQAALLVYFDGLNTREAAAALGISTSALKTRLHRARRALRSIVDGSERPQSSHNRERRMNMVTLEVFDVHLTSRTTKDGQHVTNALILLREQGGDRLLPIWVGEPEATSIALELEGYQVSRPLTYHFTANLLSATNVQVESVCINKLVKDTYFAIVSIRRNRTARLVEVDARPSDAINLALQTDTPIFAEEEVLTQASKKIQGHHAQRSGSAALLERFEEQQRLKTSSLTEDEAALIHQAWEELGIEAADD